MTFHVGQEVTMKDSEAWEPEDGLPHPQFGTVYRCVGKRVSKAAANCGELFLDLDGFHGWWHAERFRPVVKPTTDISIFTRMLDEARSPELVT